MKFTNSAPRACADFAPQLTALFDGEADEAQTRVARAHLLSCPACSRQWLDWTRYRDTFRSEPPPAIPPTLLWRVLIAYRVAAFARPARRRSRLPQVSAAALRGIEAPLPPRLSAHILARTTRKPQAHVMLTPMIGAPLVTKKSRFKGFKFGRAPLWAAPALALWVLLLSRADFNATLPIVTPDSAVVLAPVTPEIARPTQFNSASKTTLIPPIPVASSVAERAIVASASLAMAPATRAATPPASSRLAPSARREKSVAVATPTRVATLTSRAQRDAPVRVVPVRATTNSEAGLSRVFALALNTGQRDIARALTVPRAVSSRARVTPVVASSRAVQTPVARAQTVAARPVETAPRPARVARVSSAGSRVTLAALTSPISPIRTLSSARLRTAAFSDDSMRPRVAHPSLAGRRLARLMPDEDETPLRVSRPIMQAPTLREVSFGGADNGPKLDELRSAVDDFRASVAGDE